jgi:hypothetical protein
LHVNIFYFFALVILSLFNSLKEILFCLLYGSAFMLHHFLVFTHQCSKDLKLLGPVVDGCGDI